MSHVCMPGEGIAAESSFVLVVAQVEADELFETFDDVLTDSVLEFDAGVFMFSIFGIISGVDCDCEFDWLIDDGTIDVGCAFDTGVEALIAGIGNVFDVAGNAWSVFPIFPNTSW